MEKWYSRFRRGDVWYLHFETENGDGLTNSSVQKKSRPCVIVSCEENNLNSPTFNVLPITTRNSDTLPQHLYFRYEDGKPEARNQVVLCEQIMTVSILTFEHPKSYFMYSFSLAFMNKIDDALTRQLGLKPRVADMKVLERIVQELAENERKKIDAWKQKDTEVRVERLADMLSKKFDINLTTADMVNGTEYRDEELQQVDKESVKEMRKTASTRKGIKPEKKKKPKAKAKAKAKTKAKANTNKKNRYSTEDKAQFLDDYKNLTMPDMCEKYKLKESSVKFNVSVFKKALGIR